MANANNGQDNSAIHRARILHAEDERLTARCVAAFLEAKGHQIETVINGKEALASVVPRPGHYELLIVDHSMPELSGLQCVTVLRKMGYPGKSIVFGSPLPLEVEKEFLATGVDRILHKSSDLTSLNDAIQELLNAPAATNE
jgi:CheY-like chemotaxis protein